MHKESKYFLALYGTSCAFLCLVIIADLNSNMSLGQFTRDPAATYNAHPLIGVVSNVGILCWSAAFNMSLFCWLIYQKRQLSQYLSNFFLWSSAFTLMLLLDDLFMLHEGRFENAFFLSYFVAFALYLWKFSKILFCKDASLFWISILFFALSIGHDLAPLEGNVFVEDAFKFLGIVGWAGFFGLFGFEELNKALDRQSSSLN
jgi:hypothetical protein